MQHLRIAPARATTGGTSKEKMQPASSRVATERPVRYGAGIPDYLWRTYWWAYLSPVGVWLFDHQPIINAILFGQYRALLRTCLKTLEPARAGETLQIAAVYGILTPTLARRLPPGSLHLLDVAPIQLATLRRKLDGRHGSAHLYRANAEVLPYRDGSFQTVLLFFLLHELPAPARMRVLREAARVLRPGGTLLVADYAEVAHPHLFHRLALFRKLLERLEPFLADFWRHDLDRLIATAAARAGKAAALEACSDVFGGFYRVRRYRVDCALDAVPERP